MPGLLARRPVLDEPLLEDRDGKSRLADDRRVEESSPTSFSIPPPPVSSSQVAANRRVPEAGSGAVRKASSIEATEALASLAPRPITRSPSKRGVHGSALHPSTGGTVSRWEFRRR
jgi:hypothetical protein